MRCCFLLVSFISAVLASEIRAEAPALLINAVRQWEEGRQELAFTQRTRALNDDLSPNYERIERYDPSRPDERRWQLLAVNGRPPTVEERHDIEVQRNRKPRKRAGNPPARYLDLESARLVRENERTAHFEVGIKPEAARFVPVNKIVVEITIDKATATIDRITASLREPLRIVFGIAKIIDVDVDLRFDEPAAGPATSSEVAATSTARVMMSKFGNPVEFTWSDFKEVPVYKEP